MEGKVLLNYCSSTFLEGQLMNPGTSDYEAGVLTTKLRLSMYVYFSFNDVS
jgi:hypothetical protein